MTKQHIINVHNNYEELNRYIENLGIHSIMIVCGKSLESLDIKRYFESLEKRTDKKVVYFSDFTPNPLYESVVKGVDIFRREKCELIIAVGGGSAMDVAKCIKLYANMDTHVNYLEQKIVPNDIRFIAMPTTAGTGSEATRYAVIYYQGEKQSIADSSCIPEMVILDAGVLRTLPLYQKKATMMDAMCHAIEAFWSVNSTEESRRYSAEAIRLILDNRDKYLANEDEGNANMLIAANIAGKAINITQTTAGHAMCYKLTSLYGISHGHAAALCVKALWPYMASHTEDCIDARGKEYLEKVFADMAGLMGQTNVQDGIAQYIDFVNALELEVPKVKAAEEYEILKKSVNPVRLKNNPVKLDEESIDALYHEILK